jgi:hypothetical protein
MQPNLRLEAIRSLKVNATSTDDFEGRSFLILEQIKNTEDHLFRAVTGADSYYSEKFSTVWSRLKAAGRLAVHKASGAIWGHGERPLRLLWSIACLLFLLAAMEAVPVILSGDEKPGALWVSFRRVMDLFLGLAPARPVYALEFIEYVLYVARPIYIGLLVSVLYKYIGRRLWVDSLVRICSARLREATLISVAT